MNSIIKIQNLEKKYDKFPAVNKISFDIEKGSLFSLLGQNGAGKSTTIGMICGTVQPTSGIILFDGKEDQKFIKHNLGIVFQNCNLDDGLSVIENIKLRASLYGVDKESFQKRYGYLSQKFDVFSYENKLVKKLSGGQKRKVDILRALVHSPKVLVLDEPTTGLDPESRAQIWKVLNNLRKTECLTILLTTHYLEEADKSEYIVMIDKGNVVARGTPVELKNQFSKDQIKVYGKNLNKIKTALAAKKIVAKVAPDCLTIDVNNSKKIIQILSDNHDLFADFEVIKGNLDSVFLSVLKKGEESV